MAGIQHAILVNDTCGAPIRKTSTLPWLYFDGKLLQYKLLKNSTSNIHRQDLCDGNVSRTTCFDENIGLVTLQYVCYIYNIATMFKYLYKITTMLAERWLPYSLAAAF